MTEHHSTVPLWDIPHLEPLLVPFIGIGFPRANPHKTNILDVERERNPTSRRVKAHGSVSNQPAPSTITQQSEKSLNLLSVCEGARTWWVNGERLGQISLH